MATSTRTSPLAKRDIARLRSAWLRSPWMASQRTPLPSSRRASQAQFVFVSQNTGVSPSACSSRSVRWAYFSASVTEMNEWSTSPRSTVTCSLASMRAALRVKRRAATPAAPSTVAEKKSVWRSRWSFGTIRSTWGRKPMSTIRSASSRTSRRTLRRSTIRRPDRSMRRPGVAITIWLLEARLAWAGSPAPP